MWSFIQENWVVIIFVSAMLAMHLGHRSGHGGARHRGVGGCGGHTEHPDSSSAEEPQPVSGADRTRTPLDSTPQDSSPPREAPMALPPSADHHH